MTPPNADDAPLIVASLADLQAGALPLPTALRVLAEEMQRPTWRTAFEKLAEAVENGTSLPQALENPAVTSSLPSHLRALLNTSATGNSVAATIDMLDVHRTAHNERLGLLRALTYPGLVLLLAVTIGTLAAWLITCYFIPMFKEFGLRLPESTQLIHLACEGIVFASIYLLPLAVVGFLLLWGLGGSARVASLLPWLPLIGVVLHWSAIAELLRVTARLVEESVTLPQAFRCGAEGQTNAFIAEEARRLADEIERGMPLHLAWLEHPLLPESLGPLLKLAVGERLSGRMLRAAAGLLSARVKQRTELLKTILPPMLFLLVGLLMFAMVYCTVVPLLDLIRGLSGGGW